jgi:hypothetical protein
MAEIIPFTAAPVTEQGLPFGLVRRHSLPCQCDEANIPVTLQDGTYAFRVLPGHVVGRDCAYVRARNALIPEALEQTPKMQQRMQAALGRSMRRVTRDAAFLASMDELARVHGLVAGPIVPLP